MATRKTIHFSQDVPIIATCDVCVVGGGSSGIAAATAAARNDVDTILVERFGYLGGTSTASMVGPFMTSYSSDGSEMVIGGIFQEVIDRMVTMGGAVDPSEVDHSTKWGSFIKSGHARLTPFHPEALKLSAIDVVAEAGVRVMFHTSFVKALVNEGQLQGIVIHNKGGLGVIKAKIFVDCSADADVAADAGVPYSKGRSSDGKMQPATMFMRLGNVDDAKVEAYVATHPHETRIFEDIVTKATQEGLFPIPRKGLNIYREPTPSEWRANISRVLGIDGTIPDDLSRAEVEGRRQCRFIFEFMRKNCPGFENARLLETAAQIGIRETRHIQGLYTLGEDDVVQGRRFDDAIARCAYPIDIHDPTGSGGHLQALGTRTGDLKADLPSDAPPFYDIPFRCLVPVSMHNLLVAGRPISATHEAAASLRVIPPCYATGQAAGTAAALSVRENQQVSKLDPQQLRGLLREQGAIV